MIDRLIHQIRHRPIVAEGAPVSGLGVVRGVVMPALVGMLGAVLYVGLGGIVGEAGVLGAWLVLLASFGLALLTTFSIVSVTAETRLRPGGLYGLVSRSLGVEAGGVVGVPLYGALAAGAALYAVALTEGLVDAFPAFDEKSAGLVVAVVAALLARTPERRTDTVQWLVGGGVVVSLLAVLAGRGNGPLQLELWDAGPGGDGSLWDAFAIAFSAMLGLALGVYRASALQDPLRSVSRGMLGALGAYLLVYGIVAALLALRADRQLLLHDELVLLRIARWDGALLAGLWAAALFGATVAFRAATHLLQALVRDGVLPRSWRRLGAETAPAIPSGAATVLTLGLVGTGVLVGDFETIARWTAVLLLVTFGALNLAAAAAGLMGRLSFRPALPAQGVLSLAGAVGCVAALLFLDPLVGIGVLAAAVGLYLWLARRSLEVVWGGVQRGIWLALTRAGLMRLGGSPPAENWRPHLLVLSGAPTRRWRLVELATAMQHNRTLMTVSTIVQSDALSPDRLRAMEANIRDYLVRREVHSLVRVVAASDPFSGAERLVEAYGLGALVPNTILLGANQSPEHRERYCAMISHFYRARRNVVILRDDESRGFGARRRIDVWWGGLRGNGGLMIILAYLVQSDLAWREAEIRLKMVVAEAAAAERVRANLEALLQRVHVDAVVDVIVSRAAFEEILHASSGDADLVFLGLAPPSGDFAAYYEGLQERTAPLPSTVFVLAGQEIVFRDVLMQGVGP